MSSPHAISPLLRDCYLVDTIDFPFIKSFCDPILLHQKYVEEGLSAGEIADQIFSSKRTVWKYLRSCKIPLRAEDIGPYEQQRFGTKRVGRRLAANCAEIRTVEKMKSLRNQGYSYRDIVKILNSLNVPTRTRTAKWYVKTVYQVLNREMTPMR